MYQDLKIVNPQKIQFTIKDVDLAIVNAVRRIILAEVPNVAFHFDPYDTDNTDIHIHKNTGVLHNEFLAHRLSLIPLHFDENEIEVMKPEDYKFVLSKKNTSNGVINVTTQDFVIYNKGEKLTESYREKILPRNEVTKDHILITKLKPNLYDSSHGEEIDIECTPSVNIAKVHARWCPVSQCCFFNAVDDKLADKAFAAKVEAARKEGNVTDKDIQTLRANFNALELYRSFKRNKYDEPNEFVFMIESECRLRPVYLFFKGLKVLAMKLQTFVDHLNDDSDAVVIQQLGSVDNLFQIGIKNEDHTLMNTIQCIVFNNEVRNKPDALLTYIGYYQPHPLDNLMYIKLKFNNDEKRDKDFVKEFMTNAVQKIIALVNDLNKEWIAFSGVDKAGIVEVETFNVTDN
jgi:DNA-directed RNA polymerase II subunit RPB3